MAESDVDEAQTDSEQTVSEQTTNQQADSVERELKATDDAIKEGRTHEPQNLASLYDTFPVIEIFGPTIQGEGSMIGVKTLFIRMGGCDYRCTKCDSLHAVIPAAVKKNARMLTAEQIVTECLLLGAPTNTQWVTISGGNPAMWDLTHVVELLQRAGMRVAVETQGSIWRDWLTEVDQLTISPKGPGMVKQFDAKGFTNFLSRIEGSFNRLMGRLAVAIKIVVFDQNDFEFAAEIDQVLDTRNQVHGGIVWPGKDCRYLSLGNRYPPELGEDLELHEPMTKDYSPDEGPTLLWARQAPTLAGQLLVDYEVLLQDYLRDHRLAQWTFLPQLHVLIWGNKSGV